MTKITDKEIDEMVGFFTLALKIKNPKIDKKQVENAIINIGMHLQLRKLNDKNN